MRDVHDVRGCASSNVYLDSGIAVGVRISIGTARQDQSFMIGHGCIHRLCRGSSERTQRSGDRREHRISLAAGRFCYAGLVIYVGDADMFLLAGIQLRYAG